MGRVTAGIGVRGGTDDDRLVDLHDGSLDGVGERASGGGPHVHHHATLSRGDLMVARKGGREGKEGRRERGMVGNNMDRQNISVSVIHFAGHLRLDPSITDRGSYTHLKKNRINITLSLN